MTESNVLGELIVMTVEEGNILFINLVAMIMNNRGCLRKQSSIQEILDLG